VGKDRYYCDKTMRKRKEPTSRRGLLGGEGWKGGRVNKKRREKRTQLVEKEKTEEYKCRDVYPARKEFTRLKFRMVKN